METALTDEQKKDEEEKKGGAVTGGAGRVKQFYVKTKIVKDKHDKARSAWKNANRAKEKIQHGYKWLKDGKVHPTSSTATEQLTMQTAADMVPQGAAVIQA
jgi:hypothetical protein